jgi:alkylation response protein AidB-like acyl-CoA dehydrogenase
MLGIAVPEEYGGLGMGFVTTMLACDYLSGTTGSLATAYGAHRNRNFAYRSLWN